MASGETLSDKNESNRSGSSVALSSSCEKGGWKTIKHDFASETRLQIYLKHLKRNREE